MFKNNSGTEFHSNCMSPKAVVKLQLFCRLACVPRWHRKSDKMFSSNLVTPNTSGVGTWRTKLCRTVLMQQNTKAGAQARFKLRLEPETCSRPSHLTCLFESAVSDIII